MALYPSLEDMKLDHMEKAQMSIMRKEQMQHFMPRQSTVPSAPLYPSLGVSPPPPYTMPKPTPNSTSDSLASLYPSLTNYMGLELSPAVIAANMPEYSQMIASQEMNNEVQIATESANKNVVAPLSNQTLGLQRANISHGLREVTLCKDASGKVGLRVTAVNSGVFVCLVNKASPAARCGIRFGDQILQINGINVAGYTMDKVHDLFRKSDVNGIKVIIRDRPFERTVTLHKDSVGHVGFHFKNGQITGLVKESSAARNGLLTEHQLLEVDGQNVIGLKDKHISQIIDDAEGVVTVTIIPVYIYNHMMKKMASNLVKASMDHSMPNV